MFYPMFHCFSGALARVDLYTDIAFTYQLADCYQTENLTNNNAEIYEDQKGKLKMYSYIIVVLFWISFATFILSIIFQLKSLLTIAFSQQFRSVYNRVICTLSCLCYCSNLKAIASLVSRFSIDYKGSLMISSFSPKKAISFFKLIFEDITQMAIQVLFVLFMNWVKKGSNFDAILFLLVSILLSLMSSLLSLGLIFSDSSSFLTTEQKKKINDDLIRMIEEKDSNGNILFDHDLPGFANGFLQG